MSKCDSLYAKESVEVLIMMMIMTIVMMVVVMLIMMIILGEKNDVDDDGSDLCS